MWSLENIGSLLLIKDIWEALSARFRGWREVRNARRAALTARESAGSTGRGPDLLHLNFRPRANRRGGDAEGNMGR